MGKDDVVMLTGPGATVILSARVAEAEFASTTLTIKFAVPAVEGVPLICAPDKLNPEGSVPAAIDQINGAVPPLAWSVCE